MCNFQITSTRKCKLSPKKNLCHIHNKKNKEIDNACAIINLSQKNDILNEIIKKQNIQIKINQKNYDELYSGHIKNVNDHNELLKAFDAIIKMRDQDKVEIKNLNKTIEKKVALAKELAMQAASTRKTNQDIINNHLIENELNRRTIEDLTSQIKSMQEDYDKYQIIKKFEKRKADLIKKNIDIYNLNDQDFHNQRYLRNKIAHCELISI